MLPLESMPLLIGSPALPLSGVDRANVAGDGVAELLAADAAEVPFACTALTVNVYAVLFVKPDTVIGELAPVPVAPPGEAVTV
jgi:hypothetical protein